MSNEEDNSDALMADLDALMGEFETAAAADPDAGGLEIGALVEGKYKGGDKWYKGKIEQCRGDGSIDIKYFDGEVEKAMPRDRVRLLESTAPQAAKSAIPVSAPPSKKLHAPISSSSPEKIDLKYVNGQVQNEAAQLKESPREDEIQVMSEEEIRQLSRNTTEDRNINAAAVASDASGGVTVAKAATTDPTVGNRRGNKSRQSAPKSIGDDDEDEYMMQTGFGARDEEDDFAEAFDALDHYGNDADEDGRPGTAGSVQSSDFNHDGTLRRKPYRSKLQKPIIKAGNTVISLSQAKLFGLTNYKGAQAEIDPDTAIKQTLKRINQLTRNPPKDLSYIKSDDDIESTFKPKRSAEARSAMRNPACGYDFIDRLEAENNGFLERAEAGHGGGKTSKAIKDQAELDYQSSLDKLGCPKCKRPQSFDEFWEKQRECRNCNARYVKTNVVSGVGFEKRMREAELRRQENLKKAADDMYLYKPTKQERPKDEYGALRTEMQELLLALLEPRDSSTTYLQDEDMTLTTVAKFMRASPNFLLLPKRIQQDMTVTAITGFLELETFFKRYVAYEAKSKKNVLHDWRVSPDWSNPLGGGSGAQMQTDQARQRKERMLAKAYAQERETKLKADNDSKLAVKPIQRVVVDVDENDMGNQVTAKGGAKDADQKQLLKQLAQLNAEKANLLNETLRAAEARKKESQAFLEATKGPTDPRKAASSAARNTGGGAPSGKNVDKIDRVSSEQESKKKASREVSAKPTTASQKSAPRVDKFDALLDF